MVRLLTAKSWTTGQPGALRKAAVSMQKAARWRATPRQPQPCGYTMAADLCETGAGRQSHRLLGQYRRRRDRVWKERHREFHGHWQSRWPGASAPSCTWPKAVEWLDTDMMIVNSTISGNTGRDAHRVSVCGDVGSPQQHDRLQRAPRRNRRQQMHHYTTVFLDGGWEGPMQFESTIVHQQYLAGILYYDIGRYHSTRTRAGRRRRPGHVLEQAEVAARHDLPRSAAPPLANNGARPGPTHCSPTTPRSTRATTSPASPTTSAGRTTRA